MNSENVDLIVVGSGQGGVPLALDFANPGKRVVLFECGSGGRHLHQYGCTPSKAFLAAAQNGRRARGPSDLGDHRRTKSTIEGDPHRKDDRALSKATFTTLQRAPHGAHRP